MGGAELFWVLILLFLISLLFIGPVLAISAFVRVRHLEKRSDSGPPSRMAERLSALEWRIADLERRLAAPAAPAPPPPTAEPVPSRPSISEVAPSLPPEPARPAPPTRPVLQVPPAPSRGLPPAPRPAPAPSEIDWEGLIAGKWLHVVGLLALFLATSFFIKLAIDNEWIGPSGQVALGLIVGTGLLASSQWLLRRGYVYFSEGIAGLGAGILYLSLWAGWHYYRLIAQSLAFFGMIGVTAAMIVLAAGRRSERIALLALVGGFLTPVLVSTGEDAQVQLFTFVAALDAGLIGLAWTRGWRLLEIPAFVGTQAYFWGWYYRFYEPHRITSTTLFATLFFALFSGLPVIRSWRIPKLQPEQLVLVLANASMYLLALHRQFWPEHRWTLTLAVLALSVAHLGVARAVPRPSGVVHSTRLLFAGLALTFATLAIPIRLEGEWITLAWAVEGAVLLWSGLRTGIVSLRAGGWILFGIVAVRLAFFHPYADRVLFNPRFGTFMASVACFSAALYFLHRFRERLEETERPISALLAVAINVYALWALSLEVWDALEGGTKATLAQQLGLSVLWTAYATALIVLGVRRGSALLRWQALGLFGLTAGKVFLYDLAWLERVYRILSFLVLGAMLLTVSFLYQRRMAASKTPEEDP